MPQNTFDNKPSLVHVTSWKQAITWANVDPVLCRYMALLHVRHNGLIEIIPVPTGHWTCSSLPTDVLMLRPDVDKLTIIGSDNGLSPGRCQAIVWTNAGKLLIGTLGINFSKILTGIQTFSFMKIHFKMSAKWRPFCLDLNVLLISHVSTEQTSLKMAREILWHILTVQEFNQYFTA